MTIAAFGTASSPADAATLYDGGPDQALTPPASMVAGDLVVLIPARRNLVDLAIGVTGGQSWNAGTLRQSGTSASVKIFWCRFNGTWAANPTIVSASSATILISLLMLVARPTTGSNTWALDIAESFHTYAAPVSPFDVTVTGGTTAATSTIAFAIFFSLDKNTWQIQAAGSPGWANFGSAQYRNVDTSGGSRNMSMSVAYKVLSAAGATGNVVNRQLTLGGDPGLTIFLAFKEQGSGVSVSDAGDETYYNGESGVIVSGASFGATKGSGDVIISPTNNIADASAVSQPTSSWSDTSITLGTLDLSSFGYFTNLYLFVKNNSGQSNSTGLIVQREAIANISVTVKTIAGTTEASLTGLIYKVTATDILGTVLMSGTTESTDGSGLLTIGSYTLVSGGALAPNDEVWLTLCKNGASQALSFGTCVKLTPTYT